MLNSENKLGWVCEEYESSNSTLPSFNHLNVFPISAMLKQLDRKRLLQSQNQNRRLISEPTQYWKNKVSEEHSSFFTPRNVGRCSTSTKRGKYFAPYVNLTLMWSNIQFFSNKVFEQKNLQSEEHTDCQGILLCCVEVKFGNVKCFYRAAKLWNNWLSA